MMRLFESHVILNRRCSFVPNLIVLVLFSALIISGLSGCDQIFPPLIPNEIVETIPAHDETDVPIDTVIKITFTKSVNQDSLNVWAIPAIDYEASWSTDNTQVTLTPSEDMLEGTSYLVTIEEASFDDDSSLSQPVSFVFTTAGGDHSTVPLAQSEENEATMTAIVENIDRLLLQGEDAGTVCDQVVQILKTDSRVEAAGVDTDSNALWVNCVDGETQIFQVVDGDTDDWLQIPESGFLSSGDRTGTLSESPDEGTAAISQATTRRDFRLPASNKALLANGYEQLHKNVLVRDSTNVVEVMLSQRGYEVTRHALTLEDFDQLGNYGVILLETHGTWRSESAYYQIIDKMGSQYVLLTTTRVTNDNYPPDIRDLSQMTTPLVSWTIGKRVMIVNGVRMVFKMRRYGVTADYIREKVSKFPNGTVLFLNSCRSLSDRVLDDETVSPIKNVFFEKCDKGGLFLGWNGKTSFFTSVRAALNFFQYATASNKSVSFTHINSSGERKTVYLLKEMDVPWGGNEMTAQGSFKELTQHGYTHCSTFGGSLKLETQSPGTYENILMPHVLTVNFDPSGEESGLYMYAENTPEVTIGSTKTQVTFFEGSSFYWNMKVPPGVSGELMATESGRTSVPRWVYYWSPQISIKGSWLEGTGKPPIQFDVTMKPDVRATLELTGFRNLPSDILPPATFNACSGDYGVGYISWNVWGEGEWEGTGYHVTYSGTGSRIFKDGDSFGMLCDFDGLFAMVSGGVSIPYTETLTGWGSEFTDNWVIPVTFSRENVSVDPFWTIGAQSFTDDYSGFSVSWGAFEASPPFDDSLEPR